MPRRLVYVVNRRTVVDQTTIEVERIKARLGNPDDRIATEITQKLIQLAGSELPEDALQISTLRGQYADNREWSSNPARPAVVVGTVDMIGSRLLFSGYGVGFKGKPLHAGFLGQDVLLVHDEAHLEPAFQELLTSIEQEQKIRHEFRQFQVMELSATARTKDQAEVFGLSKLDYANNEVRRRIDANKSIFLHPWEDEKKLVDRVIELSQGEHTRNKSVLVFVRKVDDVDKIVARLPKDTARPLTGTLRGYERDRMAGPLKDGGCPIFARFLPPPKSDAKQTESNEIQPQPGTVYLVCTSAGEVGVNISADHLICDLSTFESMAQRFGRVNRFGDRDDTRIDIIFPTELPSEDEIAAEEKKDESSRNQKLLLDGARRRTLELLQSLNGDGSPKALNGLDSERRRSAFTPDPTILPTTSILFDSWALTTIRDTLPGRPEVEPYIRGIDENQTPETQFAWRLEVELLTDKVRKEDLEEYLDQLPLKPHELLRVPTFGKGRAYDQLQKIADRKPELPVWLIEPDGTLITDFKIADLVVKRGTDPDIPLMSHTVVLPPAAGGLTDKGVLDGSHPYAQDVKYDVAELNRDTQTSRLKLSVDTNDDWWFEPLSSITTLPEDLKAPLAPNRNRYRDLNSLLRQLKEPQVRPKLSFKLAASSNDEDEAPEGIQEYLIVQSLVPKKQTSLPPAWPRLHDHLNGVRQFALSICRSLNLDEKLSHSIELAALWHDLGKGRAVWQRGAGNAKTQHPVAKTIHGQPPENLNRYRHELGSLVDVCGTPEFARQFERLDREQQDLVLHLIAVHHGRGRPHFPALEVYDFESPDHFVEAIVNQVPSRYARLQRKYGRWGLAYIESILRAADALDSLRIEEVPLGEPEPGEWPKPLPKAVRILIAAKTVPSIRIKVDLTNPGQFFACCGIFELANLLWPDTEAWFEMGEFLLTCGRDLDTLFGVLVDCPMSNTMKSSEHARYNEISEMSGAERKSAPGTEEEQKTLSKKLRESPIVLLKPFHITVDWFINDRAGGSRYKTWAGQQSVLNIATAMKDALRDSAWRNEDCLRFSARNSGLPFNFDSDLGSQGGAIDVGFSFDPLAGSALTKIEPMARPALELLAFIGLQRFRPQEFSGENRFQYTAWNRPLPIEVAMPAACGALPISGSNRFEFRLLYRTKYLKSFLPAIPVGGGSDE